MSVFKYIYKKNLMDGRIFHPNLIAKMVIFDFVLIGTDFIVKYNAS